MWSGLFAVPLLAACAIAKVPHSLCKLHGRVQAGQDVSASQLIPAEYKQKPDFASSHFTTVSFIVLSF